MNAETMQGLGFDDMQRALDEIRKKLRRATSKARASSPASCSIRWRKWSPRCKTPSARRWPRAWDACKAKCSARATSCRKSPASSRKSWLRPRVSITARSRERDAALKGKLDEFLKKAVAELGQLTELFPDREGPDDPSLLTNLDDATMNALLRNLIAKLQQQGFPRLWRRRRLHPQRARQETHAGPGTARPAR